MSDFDIKKAKRRIRRFIKTGEHQARVHTTEKENVYEYKIKHYVLSKYFRVDKIGRIYLM